MYQSIGIAKILKLFAIIALVVAVIMAAVCTPTSFVGWWKPISAGVSISSILILGLGQSAAFPWLCRQKWVRDVAPDISGTWRATLNSNWPTIATMANLNPGDGAPVTAEVKVVARLLRVKINLCSDSKYSKSKSASVSVARDEENGDVRLYYTYENTTENPVTSDCSHHFGSAYLDVSGSGDQMVLEGLYWTNRKWNTGLNTAGTIRWERITPSNVA